MKMSLTVLTLTVAALLEHRVAAAQEHTSPPRDEPRDREKPTESRFRFGIEQTIATFQHASWADHHAVDQNVLWGNRPTDFTADLRVIDRFEVGLAVGVLGGHFSSEYSNAPEGHGEHTLTSNSLRVNPRVGYAVPLDPRLSLVPRVGIEYTHATQHQNTDQGSLGLDSEAHFLSLTPGLMLQYRPVSWLFAGTVADFSYQMHMSSEEAGGGWFSEQPVQAWWVDWMVAVGGRI
jgi:hypothetical protein